ncbi:MAG: TrkH family potassium uptake protein, partial [Candidatus Aenigmarchaeota archaeon]|nr:TrkH family potassium uptake protein [Candidatus Aenigmarchaeota archaeon]
MRTIFPYIGLLLEIFSVFLILPLIVAFFYNEPTTPFFIALIVSLFAGIILEKTSKRKPLNFWDALSLTALSFIIFSVLGSIPYLFYINGPAHITFINAFFESLSGFTTTGLSIFSTVANLPKSILFWRALTQWMGGMGIIIIFLSVLRSVRTSSMTLYRSQGLSEKIEPSLISTSRYILKIFITYTLLGIVALFATGLPLFDSITTAFTAISTGGFTVVDTFYTNPATLAVISILMLLGSINFILHSKLFKKNFNEFLKNPEVKGIAVMLIFLISAGFIVSGSLSISIFQMISALTATGFSITDTAS